MTGIAATVAASDGLFLGGTPPQAKVDPQWSPWQLQSRAIHLDAVHDGISPKGWLVLESAGDAKDDKPVPLPRLYQVVQAERSDSHDAVKGGQFSRVTVDRDDGLAQYDRTATQALFQSESLELYDDKPVFGTTLQLNRFVLEPKSGPIRYRQRQAHARPPGCLGRHDCYLEIGRRPPDSRYPTGRIVGPAEASYAQNRIIGQQRRAAKR